MAVVVKHVTFGTKGTFPIVFSSNALYKLEEKTGLSTERIGLLMFTGRAGYHMMQIILWAALEAARVREKLRREAFTIEEVGDLLDEEGGSGVVWLAADDGMEERDDEATGAKVKVLVREPREMHPICVAVTSCWEAAFPKQRKIEGAPNPPVASDSVPAGTND
jgi:hypothetical protein